MFKKFSISVCIPLIFLLIMPDIGYAQTMSNNTLNDGKKRFIGKIINISTEHLKVEDRNGEIISFSIDENTRFRHKGVGSSSVDEFEVGDWIFVIASIDAQGEFLALVVTLPREAIVAARNKFDRKVLGRVSTVSTDTKSFLLYTASGENLTFYINDDTNFKGILNGFIDLRPGMMALVAANNTNGNTLMAEVVFVRKRTNTFAGLVSSIEYGSSQFSITLENNDEVIISVNDATEFRGEISSICNIQTGMNVLVRTTQEKDGTHTARFVLARLKTEKWKGRISSIDNDSGSFELITRQSEGLTFLVNEDTRYHSRDGSIQSLEDLQSGMLGLIVAKKQSDQSWLATQIIVGNKARWKMLDLRVRGKITSINQDSFIIEDNNQREVNLLVDEKTIFQNKKGDLENLHDLEPGMIVFVGAKQLEDNNYLARLVFVMDKKAENTNP